MDFFEHIKSLRIKNGFTQKQVANFLNMTPRGYQNYEMGTRFPSIDTLKKLSKLYKIDLEDTLPTKITPTISSGDPGIIKNFAKYFNVSDEFLITYVFLSAHFCNLPNDGNSPFSKK